MGGAACLALLGLPLTALLLPRGWRPYRLLAAPFYGWIALVAVGYPLNLFLPFRPVIWLLGGTAVVAFLALVVLRRRAVRGALGDRDVWLELALPGTIGAAAYAASAMPYVRQGTLSLLVVDSEAEHFPNLVAALLASPIGTSLAAQEGLEETPVGLTYHYAHAVLSAVSGLDTFSTAVPSHLLMAALGVFSVYLFARAVLRLTRALALLGAGLYALGSVQAMVGGLGWGQQTSAGALMPFAFASLGWALRVRHAERWAWREVVTAGAALGAAAVTNYTASAPLAGLVVGAAATGVAVSRVRAIVRDVGGVAEFAGALRRVAAIGLVALLVGGYTHVVGARFFSAVARGDAAIDESLGGRGVHVPAFASLAAALGVAPLDVYRDVPAVRGEPLLEWRDPWGTVSPAAAATALALAAVGVVAAARRAGWALWAIVAAPLAYALVLRVVRPYPYGEFKLLTAVWFLAPALVAAGAGAALRGRRAWLVPAGAAACAGVLVYAGALWAVRGHAERFLALPWGALLPERDVRHVRQLVRTLPAGASVLVSNQLTRPAASEAPVTERYPRHLRGMPSAEDQAAYLGRRWRGVVTSLVAFRGAHVYGYVQQQRGDLQYEVPPRSTHYLLLDASEDPRLFGLLPADAAGAAGQLRLYRQTLRPFAGVGALAGEQELTSGGILLSAQLDSGRITVAHGERSVTVVAESLPPPPPRLPIEESFPGMLHHQARPRQAPPPPPSAPACQAGHAVIGFHALAPLHVTVRVTPARGAAVERELALWPGLSWYATPAVAWPASLAVQVGSESASVRPVSLVVACDSGLAEDLTRSAAGAGVPLLTWRATPAAGGGLDVDVWFTSLGSVEPPRTAALAYADGPWQRERLIETSLHLGPGARHWRAALRPGAPPQQTASDGRAPPTAPAAWIPPDGDVWLWLRVGAPGRAPVHEPLLARSDAARMRVEVPAWPTGATVLPLAASGTAPVVPANGAIVRGSGADLFLVQESRARWIPSLAALERLRPTAAPQTIDDRDLWRLPVGLPLD